MDQKNTREKDVKKDSVIQMIRNKQKNFVTSTILPKKYNIILIFPKKNGIPLNQGI